MQWIIKWFHIFFSSPLSIFLLQNRTRSIYSKRCSSIFFGLFGSSEKRKIEHRRIRRQRCLCALRYSINNLTTKLKTKIAIRIINTNFTSYATYYSVSLRLHIRNVQFLQIITRQHAMTVNCYLLFSSSLNCNFSQSPPGPPQDGRHPLNFWSNYYLLSKINTAWRCLRLSTTGYFARVTKGENSTY